MDIEIKHASVLLTEQDLKTRSNNVPILYRCVAGGTTMFEGNTTAYLRIGYRIVLWFLLNLIENWKYLPFWK